ncbi:MAG: hypothetical protein ACP5GX_06890 [Anaerolineae bacterium]
MRIRKVLWIILGLIILVGCTGESSSFTDDFSDPASGWGAASTETYVRGYDSGQYLIRLDAPHWYVWATAGRRYDDVSVEAVVHSEGTTDNHFGLLCRASGEGFYYFAISADGYYAIYRRTAEGQFLPLTGPAMLRSSLINTGGTSNRLLAVCEETTLALYVNGEQVAQVMDDTLASGDIGMAAGIVARGDSTLVWFDDLQVTRP